jgi:hypothetical protein
MGNTFLDQYSYLHFAVGILFRFFNISLPISILVHTLFEILENTNIGVHFIDTYLLFWPGGKQKADTLINSVGDTFFFIVGWLSAHLIITV